MKVAVLMGGLSKEREISFQSGKAVAKALKAKGHQIDEIDANEKVIHQLEVSKPESVFIALHGKFGEDGTIQGILEWMRIPYTGPSVLSSALCFDKWATKEYLVTGGIQMPLSEVYLKGNDLDEWCANFSLDFPCIVKPNTEGSTIGITRVYKREELKKGVLEALKFDRVVLVERLIEGREITVGVHNGRPLPIVEVVPKSGFYDYEAKYTKGMTEYNVPAKLEKETTEKVLAQSGKIFNLLQCEGAVRVDYMLGKDEEPYFLEVNTIPGMTETSLLPKAASVAGIGFEDLCEQILQSARLKIAL